MNALKTVRGVLIAIALVWWVDEGNRDLGGHMGFGARYELNRDKFLSETEVGSLEIVLQRSLRSPDSTRDAIILLVCLHTGGRASEVLNLKKSDFNRDDASLYLRGLKGSSCREIPLPAWLGRELEKFSRQVHPGERLFPITYNRLRQIWTLYRPARKKLHSLRHTFAIRLYLKYRDVALLKMALGHRSIQNTMIYIEYVYSMTELRKILRKGTE